VSYFCKKTYSFLFDPGNPGFVQTPCMRKLKHFPILFFGLARLSNDKIKGRIVSDGVILVTNNVCNEILIPSHTFHQEHKNTLQMQRRPFLLSSKS